ncbi:MAG: TetR family transcriptional regulator [Phenylobacterium sp.]|nr:TetR family transcriptional regulator [Phenylobacterium sp.]
MAARARPQQTRSQATLERILALSAQLLEEVGLKGFNTNLLAQRGDMSVRAIYRYFPNKWAILVAMADRLRLLERAWIGDLRHLAVLEDWREVVDRSIDGYFVAASHYTGYAALRAASQASPELRRLDDEISLELTEDLAAGLQELGVDLPEPRLNALCQTIMQSANRILEIALLAPPAEAELLVGELKRMITNLLADYVPATSKPRGSEAKAES